MSVLPNPAEMFGTNDPKELAMLSEAFRDSIDKSL